MTNEELFELLELESPLDFEYFEQFAQLMECCEEISLRQISTVFSEIRPELLAEMVENYFEDMLQGIPDSAADFHLQMLAVQQSLCGLALAADDNDLRRQFADELHRFRQWYLFDSLVGCPTEEQDRGSGQAGGGGQGSTLGSGAPDQTTVFDALTCCRIAKLENDEPGYDFSTALDYSVSEYVTPLGDLLDAEPAHPSCGHRHGEGCGDYGCESYDDYDGSFDGEDYEDDCDETLVHRYQPVIDGQWSE